MSYILQFIVFIIALLGIVSKSVKTDEKGNSIHTRYGLPELTRTGKIITTLLCTSFLVSLVAMYQSSQEPKELERILNNFRLERDLEGVEISFTPSAEQWSQITETCDKIAPPAPGFPYCASTITAEWVGAFWRIDFSEIRRPAGTVRPGPLSTNQPDGKVFEEVINKALLDFLIIWGNGLETEISPRGNYPSSITVSQDMITYTLRPPVIRLNLAHLTANPTITFRGTQYRPSRVRVRSLDNTVMFDKNLDLNWKEQFGDRHIERMMPYISGPHPLDIIIKNVSR